MNKPVIAAIAAIGKNRELGKNGKLIWRIPEDMRHFKEITTGHPVIMGRKTYESMGKPLPNRVNIVITRNADYKAEGCIVVQTIEDAITQAKKHLTSRHPERSPQGVAEGSPSLLKNQNEIFIIGGGQIYEQAMRLTDKLYLTIVDSSSDADTYFPQYDDFKLIEIKKVITKSRNIISFCTYKKQEKRNGIS